MLQVFAVSHTPILPKLSFHNLNRVCCKHVKGKTLSKYFQLQDKWVLNVFQREASMMSTPPQLVAVKRTCVLACASL